MVIVEYVSNDDSLARYLKAGGASFEYLFLMDGDTNEEMRHCMAGMLEWCRDFTEGDSARWLVIPRFRCIAFRDQSDAFAFRMRWC